MCQNGPQNESFVISEFSEMADTGTLLFALLKEDFMTDVTFVVQELEVKAHGVVVSCRGGKLRKMVEEKKEKIEIENVSPETFNTILE